MREVYPLSHHFTLFSWCFLFHLVLWIWSLMVWHPSFLLLPFYSHLFLIYILTLAQRLVSILYLHSSLALLSLYSHDMLSEWKRASNIKEPPSLRKSIDSIDKNHEMQEKGGGVLVSWYYSLRETSAPSCYAAVLLLLLSLIGIAIASSLLILKGREKISWCLFAFIVYSREKEHLAFSWVVSFGSSSSFFLSCRPASATHSGSFSGSFSSISLIH